MKKLLLFLSILLVFGCSTDEAVQSPAEAELQTASMRLLQPRLPKRTNIILRPTAVNNNPVGRYMETPIPYDGILEVIPSDGLVDWDNDGDLDLITQEYGCETAFRQYVFYVSIDQDPNQKVAICYTASRATILGFEDVNGDGYQDVLLYGGKTRAYNAELDIYGNYTIENNSYVFEPVSYFNVGINTEGQYPLSTTEILASMEVSEVENGQPNNLVWDLSAYGYHAYTFYVDFWEGQNIGDGQYYGQTWTYGFWGFYFNDRLARNQEYTISFRYMDNCDRLNVTFINN